MPELVYPTLEPLKPWTLNPKLQILNPTPQVSTTTKIQAFNHLVKVKVHILNPEP